MDFGNVIKNDTEWLENKARTVAGLRHEFGDVNLQMINMINGVSGILEGQRMKDARITTFRSVNQIKNSIAIIDDSIRYISELNEALREYLKCEFREV